MEPKKAANNWFTKADKVPNSTELLLFASLIVTSDVKAADIRAWAASVMRYFPVFQSQGASGLLPEYRKTHKQRPSDPYQMLANAYKSEWGETRLDSIGKAIQMWRGLGQHDGLSFNNLKRHPREVKGRWELPEALFGVASILKSNLSKLRKLLNIQEDLEELPEAWQVIEELQADKENLGTKLEDMEVEKTGIITDLKKKLKNKTDAHAISAKRLKTKNRAVTEARRDERNKLAKKHSRAKEEMKESLRRESEALLEEQLAEKRAALEQEKQVANAVFGENRLYLNTARARAREAETERDKAWRKLEKVEAELEELKHEEAEEESDEDSEEESEDEESPLPARNINLEFMRDRRDEHGRWHAEDEDLRACRHAQLARGVAPSTCAANVQDILDLLAPGNSIASPCTRSSQIQRGEVTLSGEAMAAWKFAECKRVMTVGWDESTKFTNSVFAIYCQVEMFDGSIEEVCLRGMTVLPDGGTSAAVLAHIEQRIFAYSRTILTYWREEFEKKEGRGSWKAAGGPDPDNIGLHRLCEDTVLMTDTCHGARCTKRLCAGANQTRACAADHYLTHALPHARTHPIAVGRLAEAVMLAIQEKVGKQEWEKMSEEERDKKYKVFRGDCWQHLRNIIIQAMATVDPPLPLAPHARRDCTCLHLIRTGLCRLVMTMSERSSSLMGA